MARQRNFGWNSVDIGPKRDVVAELSSAFRAQQKVVFGLYHSLFEWFHPLYLADKQSNYTRWTLNSCLANTDRTPLDIGLQSTVCGGEDEARTGGSGQHLQT